MKLKPKELVRAITSVARKHSPEILTGIGIAGMAVSVIFAAKATPKALEAIRRREGELKQDPLPPVEAAKTAAKYYIPSAVSFGLSTACLIGASSTNLRRNAALATAYSLSETALKEYQDKTLDLVGPKKEQQIRTAIDDDKLTKQPVNESQVIFTGKGEALCYDPWTGRYFKHDIEKLRRAVEDLSFAMQSEMYVNLNDFYDLIDLERTEAGDLLGWDVSGGPIRPSFDSHLATDGTPCLVIRFNRPPAYDFRR